MISNLVGPSLPCPGVRMQRCVKTQPLPGFPKAGSPKNCSIVDGCQRKLSPAVRRITSRRGLARMFGSSRL